MNNDNNQEEVEPRANTAATISEGSSSSSGRQRKLNNRTIALILIVVLLFATALVYSYLKTQSKNSLSDTDPTDYSFDAEEGDEHQQSHLLKGGEPKTGFGFKLPLNDVVYSDSPFDKVDERFAKDKPFDQIVDEGNAVILGQRIVTGNEGEANAYFQSLAAALIVQENEQEAFNMTEYFSQVISGYVFGTGVEDASKVAFGLNQPEAFANNNIEKGAQIYQFNAFSTAPTENQPVKKLTGYLVEVKGKNANYYMLLGAIESVWLASPDTWQAVINSIDVDL